MIDLARKLAEFICGLSYDNLPSDVQEKAKTCTLNGIGIGIASHKLGNADVARNIVKEYEEKLHGKKGTLFMDGGKASLSGAVFANATMFHSRIQEDTHIATHAGIFVLPVVLGIAENSRKTGKEIFEAVVAGYETTAALGKELTGKTTQRGFRPSPIYGIFGAVAAAGKLLKLNVDEITNALNIAVALAGGTNEASWAGTWEGTFQMGVAARNGLMAALIASNGIIGAKTAFTGKAGFIYAFAGIKDELCAERIVEGLGEKFQILEVSFKPYPTCAFNQTPYIITLDLVEENNIMPEDVLEITYYMNTYESNYPGMRFKGPLTTELNRILSTPFTIALAIKERRLYKSDLTQPCDKEVMDIVDRITVLGDDRLDPLSGTIEIKMTDGSIYKEEMVISPGYYAYDWDKVVNLISNVHHEVGISEEQTSQLISAIKNLHNAEDANVLIKIIEKPIN